jgi:predicted Zn finger-like uncharacterized protein
MTIVVACPSCHARMRAAEELLGKQVKCARCAHVFEATQPPAPSRPPEPEVPRPRPAKEKPIAFQPDEDYSRSGQEDRSEREDRRDRDDRYDRRDRDTRSRVDRDDFDDRDDGRDRYDRDRDYDDRYYRRKPRRQSNTLSMIAMIMGIVGLPIHCLCGALGTVVTIPISITTIVLGILGYRREKANGQAIAGIVLGIINLLVDILLIVLFIALVSTGAMSGPGGPFAPIGSPPPRSGGKSF